MSIKLKFKNLFFQGLTFLPENQANEIYHIVQKLMNNESLEFKIGSAKNTFRTFEDLTKSKGINIEEKTIAEIGSGWLPLMPYFFKFLGGAKKVKTFDLNRHYQKKNIELLNGKFSRRFKINVIADKESKFSLPRSISYFPNTNIADHCLNDCDLVFSRFVLEHVRPEAIEEMHRKFKNELNPGTLIIHMISPGDHRAYIDKKLSLQDFLQFSEDEWINKYSRFDYHNRLRLPQYLNIFNKLNFEIVHLGYEVPDKDSEIYKKFKQLELHQDFKQFTDEELLAGAINIILKV